jgi:hypothetical protein
MGLSEVDGDFALQSRLFRDDVVANAASEDLNGRVERNGGKFAQLLHAGAACFATMFGLILVSGT